MAISALSEELSEDGTLTVHVSDGSKVKRVLVMGDNIFGGLYYPDSAENKGEPKTGHWIEHVEHCESIGAIPSGLGAYKWCSNCDCGIDVREWHRNNYNYCPNCGADMRPEPYKKGE